MSFRQIQFNQNQENLMKNKTSIKLIAFAITLLFSITIVITVFNNNIFSFFDKKEDNLKARVKIHRFLLADKERDQKTRKLTAEQILKLRSLTTEFTLQLNEEAKNLHRKELEVIIKTLQDERVNADTSELPEDFREAWSKFTIATKNNSKMHRSDGNSKVTTESKESLSEELTTSAEEFRRVVKNYGFELGSDFVLIDEES